jgi:hypothetical protein
MQALSQAVSDCARGRGEVPNIRPLDRSCDNEQGMRCFLTGIGAKAPLRSGRYNLIGTLAGAESECSDCIALRAAQHVRHTELSSAESV